MSVSKSPPNTRIHTLAPELGKDLGRRLRYLRAQLGVTQSELAQRTAMGRAYISKVEHGKILPRYATLVRMAVSLGVEVEDLVRSSSCQTRSGNVPDRAHS
jgi:transcriptional regulator with XRE-family HTH domain